jgi:tRNA A-37 threonylcarbamoyl transferase component Bud32
MLNCLEQSARISLNRYRWNCTEAENSHQLGLRLLTAAQLLYQRREYSLMRESISRAIRLNNVSLIRLAAVWCFEGKFGRHFQARWVDLLRYSSRLGDLKSKFTLIQYQYLTKAVGGDELISALSSMSRDGYARAFYELSQYVLADKSLDINKRLDYYSKLLQRAVSLNFPMAAFDLAFQYLFGYKNSHGFSNALFFLNFSCDHGFDVAGEVALQLSGLSGFDDGDMVDKSLIPQPIAKGAFAEIYAATFKGQDVVYKIYKQDSSFESRIELDDSVKREITVLSLIASRVKEHVNLVSLIGISLNQEYPFVILKRYPQNLRTFIFNNGVNNFDDCRRILVGLCAAVNCLHSMGVLHCDIKLENVLLQFKGHRVTPVLTDFGSSKLLPGNSIDLMHLLNGMGSHTTKVYCAYEFHTREKVMAMLNAKPGFYTRVYKHAFQIFNEGNYHDEYRQALLAPDCLLYSISHVNVQRKIQALKKLDIFSMGMVMLLVCIEFDIFNQLPHQMIHGFFSKLVGSAEKRYATTAPIVRDWDNMLKP